MLQEGDAPTVDPTALLAQYRDLAKQHEQIVRRINRTNVGATITSGAESMTLADAVIRRERLAKHAGVLRELTQRAMPGRSRWLRTEVKHVPAFDVASVVSAADTISREHRELDTLIQKANWEVDVVD